MAIGNGVFILTYLHASTAFWKEAVVMGCQSSLQRWLGGSELPEKPSAAQMW